MRRRRQKSRRQRRTITLNCRISRGSIETAIPSSRPERSKAGVRSGGQGRPKGAASRREAPLTVASTTASWARRDDTTTRVDHLEHPLTPIDVLRPRREPNQHIQPVIAKPPPESAVTPPDVADLTPTAPSMRGFSPPATREFVLPVFLFLGLLTRLSALGLLAMTTVIQIFVYPDGWWTAHAYWVAILIVLIARGPGAISLDRLVFRN